METINYGNQIYVATTKLKVPEYYQGKELAKQKQKVKKSIEKYGVKRTLVVNQRDDGTNIIIDGVQIFEIAKEIGIAELPVFFVELGLEDEKLLSVTLNQKAKADLSEQQIIDLVGQISFESFFADEIKAIDFNAYFSPETVLPRKLTVKKSIKRISIPLSEESKIKFYEIVEELNAPTFTDAIETLIDIYNDWKEILQKDQRDESL
ncbi:ParB N-terminal domain-containing protein [Pedobacter nanyangensis]|uniref:ParB N-terminal domain-containing protein n=1 Tax=Pedobacter nanyangensis TaxID=1562389 RepID=UPI000DE304B2|nr:ParB N-terminal domain-containing protein [Pedobacter nanyangensis]